MKNRILTVVLVAFALVVVAVAVPLAFKAATPDSGLKSDSQQEVTPNANSENETKPNDSLPSNENVSALENNTSSTANNSTTSNDTASSDIDTANSATDTTNHTISEEEARNTAMPDIEKYANEHNRTIASVNAKLYNATSRVPRPSWEIRASYVRVEEPGIEHWIIGYTVLVWADTGEIRDSGVEGIM